MSASSGTETHACAQATSQKKKKRSSKKTNGYSRQHQRPHDEAIRGARIDRVITAIQGIQGTGRHERSMTIVAPGHMPRCRGAPQTTTKMQPDEQHRGFIG